MVETSGGNKIVKDTYFNNYSKVQEFLKWSNTDQHVVPNHKNSARAEPKRASIWLEPPLT